MEETKIRIGNDICLNVALLYSDGIISANQPNINSVEAFVVNVTKEKEFEEALRNKTRFISRFPVEPYIDAYSSTAYDIKSSGYPTWRSYPQNYIYGTYSGFGPNTYWPKIYRPVPECNLTEYRAPVLYTQHRNIINVYFPAKDQLYTGTYKLIIVAKIYDPGYSTDNLRTVTVDYDNVFTLVSTSQEGADGSVTIADGSVTINVNQTDSTNPTTGEGDIFVNSGNYSNGNIALNLTNGLTVDVDLSKATNWYEGQ